jgi:1-acyl-sn-glycerol-3-phosphate acyltransferase
MEDARPAVSPLTARLADRLLRAFGWTCIDLPQRPVRAVVVGYPHTSNWDFPIALLAMAALRLDARWVGKDSLFRGPLGPLMRGLGGIPVNRREPTGFVERIAGEIRSHPRFMLVMAPEGTRSWRPGWKSGFYRIARAAGVPVVVAVVDYANKRIGLQARVDLTGDEAADMAAIADLCRDCRGLRPELASPVRML